MTVGVVAECIVLAIGVPLGALAGYYGGRLDMILMRFVDVMYAFPRLLFVIMIMSMLGRGLLNIFIAIGLTGWVRVARLTRAQMLSLKSASSVRRRGLLARGIWRLLCACCRMPSRRSSSLTFGIPEAIFTEAALSFIGVGISPPTRVGDRWWESISSLSGRIGISASSRLRGLRPSCSRLPFWAMGCGTRWIRNSTSKGKGRRMQIDHTQVALLAERLHAIGVGRREFLKVVGPSPA